MKRSVWISFGGLCLLSASSWIAEPLENSTLPSLERQGLIYAVIGLIALLLSIRSPRPHLASSIQLALISILFFGLPALTIEVASGSIPATSRSALFAMVPVVVILMIASGEAEAPEEAGARNLLVPALIGIAGLFLLLPLNFSGTPHGILMIANLALAVALAGVSSVWLHRLLQRISLPGATAIICLSNAAFLLACSSATRTVWTKSDLASIASPGSLIDILEILLILWLLQAMSPIRFATRYLLIPLLTVFEGFILVHPPLTLRILGGTTLLFIGTAMLLFLKPSTEEEILSLR